jgi:serine protease Do
MRNVQKLQILLLLIIAFLLGFISKNLLYHSKHFEPSQVIAEDGKHYCKRCLEFAQELSDAFSYIAEKSAPAVVYIETEKVVTAPLNFPFDFFGDEFLKKFFAPPSYRERGAGSGFIISPDGYIVTNNHVIQGAQKITVKLVDGRVFKAKVIGTDPFSDVALIKIDAKDLPTLPLGNSDLLRIGEWVIAIGNPFGLTHTVTVGVISAKGRSGIGITDIEDFIQTDAAINPGNSGGPLLNLKGEVIGMNTAIFTRSGGYMGIGFAIPINIVKTVVQQLKTKGKVERGFLGVVIQDLTPALAKELDINVNEGVLITEVMPHSPAAKAGLKVKDVIVGINGKKIKNASELKSFILLTKPGTVVTLDVIRHHRHLKIKVKIGSPKKYYYFSRAEYQELNRFLEEIGIKVSDITSEVARRFDLSPSVKGVVITEVIPGTPAYSAPLKPGFVIDEVNNKKIRNLREFYRALRPSLRTHRVLFGVKTSKGRFYVTLGVE